MEHSNVFGPFPSGERRSQNQAAEWQAVVPVPADAPPPPETHSKLGRPTARWAYRDAAGAILGHVDRFDTPEGKTILPLTWCAKPGAPRGQWRHKGFPPPRPLYGLDRLASRPQAPVVVTEGEKAADAATILLPDWVAVTSPNGSNSAATADWSPLAGRTVVIWPDNDAAGADYAAQVACSLAALKVEARILALPTHLKEGWDAADAFAEGWDTARALAIVDSSMAARTPAVVAALEDGRRKGRSVSRRRRDGSEDGGGAPPQRNMLVEAGGAAELWHSPEREPYATMPMDGHRENWPVRSKDFRRWLAGVYYDAHGGVSGGQAMEDALRVFEMKALRGQQHKTFTRIGTADGAIYLDLGDQTWRAVRIAADGWEVITDPPVKFTRSGSTRPLPEPERGESVNHLRQFFNVATDADFILAVATIVGWFRPDGPYPILAIGGEQGTGKSTAARMIRELIDPRSAGLRALPRDERDLAVAAHNALVLAFDNVSGIPDWLSDALCRLATGGGFGTRELHSDRDETIFEAARPVMVNGIPDLASRPDLADRTIAVTLAPIPDSERRDETDLWQRFNTIRPEILGALLDAVSGALRNWSTVKPDRLPRMADFARWITAAEPALGWEPGTFTAAYSDNRERSVAAAIEGDPIAALCRELAEGEGWEGTMTEFSKLTEDRVSESARKSRAWPQTIQGMSARLTRIAPPLRQAGVEIERRKTPDKKRERFITIRRRVPV